MFVDGNSKRPAFSVLQAVYMDLLEFLGVPPLGIEEYIRLAREHLKNPNHSPAQHQAYLVTIVSRVVELCPGMGTPAQVDFRKEIFFASGLFLESLAKHVVVAIKQRCIPAETHSFLREKKVEASGKNAWFIYGYLPEEEACLASLRGMLTASYGGCGDFFGLALTKVARDLPTPPAPRPQKFYRGPGRANAGQNNRRSNPGGATYAGPSSKSPRLAPANGPRPQGNHQQSRGTGPSHAGKG
jgi:hypothetical protein